MALEYFTEAELRALPQMSDLVRYPLPRVEVAAAYVVTGFERFCGLSFIPREHTEMHSGSVANERTYGIVLRKRKAIAVTTLTQDGEVVPGGEVRLRAGVVRRFATGATVPSIWNTGADNIEVIYTAGFTEVPGDVKEVALQATRYRLLSTNSNAAADERRTSINTEAGTVNFVIADTDRPTGYPEIDAVLTDYKRQRAPLVA